MENSVLLGDSGYACMPFLTTPYPEPETYSQRRFNRAHRVTRCLIERTFGVLKRRFHVLHGEVRMCPKRVCAIVVACCILHNIAIEHGEPLDEEEEEPLVEEINNYYDGVDTGTAVRNHIAATYF
ncbi:putative nuclease HARBI1 [Dendronephthya gigantea]|uniref:putative nuclease HARBI1 n=1 Tax=Dendronephthya gigantea TaxID=151771 RepID=UPI00106B5C33|nr:putative nuclease HARBI1 [Dendronephthya gigantea]